MRIMYSIYILYAYINVAIIFKHMNPDSSPAIYHTIIPNDIGSHCIVRYTGRPRSVLLLLLSHDDDRLK